MIGASLGLDRVVPSLFPPHFVTDWAHDETRVVDQVMGAFMLVRRSLFEALTGAGVAVINHDRCRHEHAQHSISKFAEHVIDIAFPDGVEKFELAFGWRLIRLRELDQRFEKNGFVGAV